jgi:putative peptidoglycan lipid II flippase
MGKHQEIARAAGLIGGATLISRVLGYVRDMIVANIFGAGLATDAFIAAYRIPNYLRRIFGEGTLNASFVPVFTETLNREGQDQAWELANILITVISSLLTLFVILGMIFTPGVVWLVAPGFTDNPSQFSLTVFLTRVTFPFAIFVGISAAFMGILNSLKHFGSPALAPAFLNIMMILSALFLTPYLSTPILSLSIGVLLGGMFQLLVQVPFLLRKKFRFAWRFDFSHPGIRKILRLMTPGIIGQSVLQINLFIGTILASMLQTGSITYLFFADRLVQFPLAIFGISAATQGTALALMYYAFGLWAFAEVRVVAQTFYALQDTWTPMKVAVVALMANLILSLILMGPLKHGGLALANSLASMLNVVILVWILRARMGHLQGMKFFRSFLKILLASLIMGLFAYYGARAPLWGLSGHTLEKMFYLGRGILFGVISFFMMCAVLRVEEFSTMKQWLFSRPTSDPGSF